MIKGNDYNLKDKMSKDKKIKRIKKRVKSYVQ